jgi:hypothetical protein
MHRLHKISPLCALNIFETGDAGMNEYDSDRSWDKSQEEKNIEVEQKRKKPRHRSTTTSEFIDSSKLYLEHQMNPPTVHPTFHFPLNIVIFFHSA